ncbi:MAG: redoxin domain-containing protein [Candidatus Omnitrophota bacterium]|nr:MAG: redoxin domain-containing protein [Candidatus Omnitrophota bacterium]
MTNILQIFISFGAGLLSFFSPCVLPLIPAYICFITGLSAQDLTGPSAEISTKKRLILTEALLFILGFSLVFVGLGASATFLGSYFVSHQKLIRIIGAGAIILFGLHLSGLLKIKFLNREKRFHLKQRPVSWLGSVLVGMAFGFGWTPCVGPILGGILMLAATADTVAQGIILLCFYSLGLALPFLMVSIGIKWVLNLFTKIRRHLKLVSVISGILLIIVGITILIPAVWANEAPSRKTAPDFVLSTIEGSQLQLYDYKGKVVILNFWTGSCPACRRAIADFIKLYDEYKDEGLVIIGINLDRGDIGKIKSVSEELDINYPVVKGDYALTEKYGGIYHIPVTFIIDREMKIVKKFVGYVSKETLESLIEELLLTP